MCRNSSVVILLRQLSINHIHFQLNSVSVKAQSVKVFVTLSYVRNNKQHSCYCGRVIKSWERKKFPQLLLCTLSLYYLRKILLVVVFECFLIRRNTTWFLQFTVTPYMSIEHANTIVIEVIALTFLEIPKLRCSLWVKWECKTRPRWKLSTAQTNILRISWHYVLCVLYTYLHICVSDAHSCVYVWSPEVNVGWPLP